MSEIPETKAFFSRNEIDCSGCNIKKQLKSLENEYEGFAAKYTDMELALKRKEQEYYQLKAKYKTLLIEHSGCYRKEWVDGQIRIKKIYEEDRQNYWQALQEIKKLVERNHCSGYETCKECYNTSTCPNDCINKEILQKCEVIEQ